MSNVLILDGNQRSALAATRSLGKEGHLVYVSDSSPESLAGSSKFCTQYIQLPDTDVSTESFVNNLDKLVSDLNIDILLPMTDISVSTVLAQKDRFKDVKIPFSSNEIYQLASNKISLFQLASRLSVPIPETTYVDDPGEINEISKQLNFPVVIKPVQSRIFENNAWLSTCVTYANSREDLCKQVTDTKWLKSYSFMLQELIVGEPQGIFAIYKNGKAVSFFAHKRLREKPPSGGVSVLRESIPVNAEMERISRKLLDDLGWHGVAMVEFIVARDGTPYLIEINGRFWGSLQLAIDAGVDFPSLLCQLALEEPVAPVMSYKTGIRLRWLLGDLDSLYLSLKQPQTGLSHKISVILAFIKPSPFRTRFEVARLSDIRPFWWEIKEYIRDLIN